jgi:hypothetical protein
MGVILALVAPAVSLRPTDCPRPAHVYGPIPGSGEK